MSSNEHTYTHSRVPSMLSVSTMPPSSAGLDGRPPSQGGSRSRSRSREPQSQSRDPSADPSAPSPSAALRPSRSSHTLGSRFVDPSTERGPRLSSLMNNEIEGGQNSYSVTYDRPLPPPPPIGGFANRASSPAGSRSASQTRARPESSLGSAPSSRPITPIGAQAMDWLKPSTPPDPLKISKIKSWIPTKSHNRAVSEVSTTDSSGPFAFIAGPSGKQPYDTTPLASEQKVSEIWNEDGDLFVYLFDSTSQTPSFRLHSWAISSSKVLTGQSASASNRNPAELRPHMRNLSLTAPSAFPLHTSQAMSRSSSGASMDSDFTPAPATVEQRSNGLHLYLNLPIARGGPANITMDGLERLIRIRNLFAFLVGQILVGSPSQPTFFYIFKNISSLLMQYEFSNEDNSSLGDAVSSSFLGYVEDLRLNDVRSSREKTLEAIVLGERMQCWPIFNEGYVHAVGKYNELIHLNTAVMSMILDSTRQKMEKSALALDSRLKTMRARLEGFEFPALFAGVLNSSSTKKLIDVNGWKSGFVAMRKQTLLIFKARYGSWPPKARSKKNDFEGSGLNRIVTRELYQEFSDLYDMLVNRTKLTTRSVDGQDAEETSNDPTIQVLRKFMSEFDRSSPPVLPPIPYDIPLLPKMEDIRRDFADLNVRKQVKERSKKAKDDEINMALMAAYNRDAVKVTPFLESFMTFERNNARGKTFDEIIDARVGQWIFVYVIMQCLPLLASDAPELRWTQGVEYFLCEPPKGSPPWIKDDQTQNKKYYSVPGGTGVVSLAADVVDHGVEGTYFRSHCWQVASQWNANFGIAPHSSLKDAHHTISTNYEPPFSPSDFVPPPVLAGEAGSRPGSRAGSRPGSAAGIRGVIAPSVEALPSPPRLMDPATSHRLSMQPDPNLSFDSILGTNNQPQKKKR